MSTRRTLPGEVYTLRYIEEPNGNRLTFDYTAIDQNPATLDTITDSAGRVLKLHYKEIYHRQRMVRAVAEPVAEDHVDYDELKIEVQYGYDEIGNLIAVTRTTPYAGLGYNDERVQRYAYSTENPTNPTAKPADRHNLTKVTDANGHVTEYVYYTENDAIPGWREPDADDEFIVAKHEYIKEIRKPEGVTVAFRYDLAAGTREVEDPRANIGATKYTVDSYGATVKTETPIGDGTFKVTQTLWCTEDTSQPGCNGKQDVLPVKSIDPLGRVHSYTYDANGNLIEENISLGSVNGVQPVLDADDNAVTEVTTAFTYDPLFNKMTSQTDAEGNTTWFCLDSPSAPPAGSPCSPTTGKTGNLLAQINAEGEQTGYAYEANGNLRSLTNGNGHSKTYSAYDAYGNVLLSIDAEGNEQHTRWDARGRLLESWDSFGHHVIYSYDGLDRTIAEAHLDDRGEGGTPQVTVYRYTPGGQLKTVTSGLRAQGDFLRGLGHTTEYTYDALNRVKRVTDKAVKGADGSTVNLTVGYTYDETGNQLTETSARGVVQTHTYDGANRRTSTVTSGPGGPAITVSTTTYDLADNPRTVTDLHGYVTTYVYDALYRVVEKQLPHSHALDGVPFSEAKIVIRYDLAGNKVSESDANGFVTSYTYDNVYRLLTTTDAVGNVATFAYDNAGNKEQERNLSSGLIVDYTYDKINRIKTKVQTVPGAGANGGSATYTTVYDYLDSENAVIVTNPNGHKTKTDHDGLDRIYQTVVDEGGLNLITTFTYDANGNIVTQKDAQNGDIDVTFEYDGLNRKTRAVYVAVSATGGTAEETFYYDGDHNLVKYVNRRGIEFSTDYDNLGRERTTSMVESITNGGDELILSETVYSDAQDNDGLLRITGYDANRNVTVTRFDSLGRPVEIDDPNASGLIRYVYDNVNKRAQSDNRGFTLKYTYDGVNRLTKTEEFNLQDQPVGTMTMEYKAAERQTLNTDRMGIETLTQQDALGRVIEVRRRSPNMTAHYNSNEIVLERYAYDAVGNVIRFTDANGNQFRYIYDGANRKTSQIDGEGSPVAATTTWTYDNVGNILTMKDGRTHDADFDVKYTYDARYRQITATDGEGNVTQYDYDDGDLLVKITEPLGDDYVTEYAYDEQGELLSVDETGRADNDTVAGVTRFFYDGNRNKIAQQDANGNLMTYKYDSLNQLTATYQHTEPGTLSSSTVRGSDPKGSNFYGAAGGDETTALVWSYGYDGNGNQTSLTDARGQQMTLSYDHLDRLLTKTYVNPAQANLDFQLLSTVYTYDPNGNILSVTEQKRLNGSPVTESIVHTYDPLDRVQTTTRTDHDGRSKLIEFDYDAQGNRTPIKDADGVSTSYTYDVRNRLETVTTEAGVTTYTWWPDGLLKSVAYPNNTIQDRSMEDAYDGADRLRTIENRRTGPVIEAYSSFEYRYDANGNRTGATEFQNALAGSETLTTTYVYDTRNQLTSVDYGNGAALAYTYDRVGNRLSEVGIDPISGAAVNRTYRYAALPGMENVTYDGVNALTQITDNVTPAQSIVYEYDANLNQTAKVQNGVRDSYVYNIADRMVAATVDGTTTRFDYDDDGMRLKKMGASSETRYLYDGRSVLLEYGASGATTHKYNYGYNLLSLTAVNGASRDNQFYLVDGLGSTADLANASGNLTQSYRYDAWGRVWKDEGTSSNQRQYTGHYHDDETGLDYFGARYYDSEIGRFLSQDNYAGEQGTPPSLHRYLYAYGNPLRWVDLTGYSSEEANARTAVVEEREHNHDSPRRLQPDHGYGRSGAWAGHVGQRREPGRGRGRTCRVYGAAGLDRWRHCPPCGALEQQQNGRATGLGQRRSRLHRARCVGCD